MSGVRRVLGQFPLHAATKYKIRMSKEMKENVDILITMRETEQLSIRFEATIPFIIEVTVNSRNAISGLSEKDSPKTFIKFINERDTGKLQDYIVVPDEKKLDGACFVPRFTHSIPASTHSTSQEALFRQFGAPATGDSSKALRMPEATSGGIREDILADEKSESRDRGLVGVGSAITNGD